MSTKRSFTTGFALVLVLLSTLVLSACGEQSFTAVAVGPKGVTTTAGAIGRLMPIATPQPTTTPEPTATPASTATPEPTATPVPTATPEPIIPTKLSLGSEADPWGEISRYQPYYADRLEEISLNKDLLNNLGGWFQDASRLDLAEGTPPAVQGGTYRLWVKPEVARKLREGNLGSLPVLDTAVRGIVSGSRNKVGFKINFRPVVHLDATAVVDVAFQLISFFTGQNFLPDINAEIEKVHKSLEEIKNFLQEKEYSTLVGDLNYLEDIRTAISQQKLKPLDIQAFRNQLESVEREASQSLVLAQTQLEKLSKTYKETRIDKNFLGQRNEDKINDFNPLIDNYDRQSKIYYAALLVKASEAQVLCALPGSQELCQDRLDRAQKNLAAWRDNQVSFYDVVINRIPEMDGLFVNGEKQQNFKKAAEVGKNNAAQAYTQTNASLAGTVEKVKLDVREASQPLLLVVELDGQGKLKKVSKLVSA